MAGNASPPVWNFQSFPARTVIDEDNYEAALNLFERIPPTARTWAHPPLSDAEAYLRAVPNTLVGLGAARFVDAQQNSNSEFFINFGTGCLVLTTCLQFGKKSAKRPVMNFSALAERYTHSSSALPSLSGANSSSENALNSTTVSWSP